MKRLFVSFLIVAVLSGIGVAGEPQHEAGEQDKEKEKEMISYILGYQIGGDFRRQSLDIDPETFAKGIQDAISNTEPRYSQEEMRDTLMAFKKKMMEAQRAQREGQAQKNQEEGKAFLDKNAKEKGVVVLPSGLQYKVIKKGSGAKPKPSDTVTVNYRGTLIDGTEFDSSYERGEPAEFRADRVIPGWTEALPLMKEGAKWQLFIPANLAYGERGAGGMIGPNSTLVFEVELISIKAEE